MKIVIDTNVLISGVFFGGFPRKVLSAVVGQRITACATAEIINEYEEIEKRRAKIRKEKQFNKQVEMNQQLKTLLKELEEIIDGQNENGIR